MSPAPQKRLWEKCWILWNTGWFFSLVPPRKVLSMELVPPNREKWLSLQRWQKTLLKKWKSKSEFVKPSLFTVTWQEFFYVWQAVTWTFTFLVGILLSLVNLVIFSLLGGTSSILRTFLGGTSEKNHPVYGTCHLFACLPWDLQLFPRLYPLFLPWKLYLLSICYHKHWPRCCTW